MGILLSYRVPASAGGTWSTRIGHGMYFTRSNGGKPHFRLVACRERGQGSNFTWDGGLDYGRVRKVASRVVRGGS